MDKYIGKRLDGRYDIKEVLGSGGMAVVYSAYDIINDRKVAIKILKDEFLTNSDFIRRFKNESKAIAVLLHPNIVKVYDVSFGDNIQYIVMENINGITLKEYIDQNKPLNWKEAVYFTTQILKALQHAHEKGIVHRDIKPQNIMLLQDGTIKVTDFGIARFSKNETRTMTDKAIGSVHYISPEQARGDITDEKADLYSVGVMLYEMITGKLPFDADNAVSVAIMQLQASPKRPREINENIPEGLEEITLKAMQKDPDNRYSSASDMLSAIELFRQNPSIRFEYKYLNREDPNKYAEAINSVKDARPKSNYGDDFSFEEPEQEKENKKSKVLSVIIGIGVGLIASVLIGLSILGFGFFNSGSKDVDVPTFIDKKLTDVVESGTYKFDWAIEYAYNPNKAEGVIIDQDPKPGSKKVKENASIKLVVNSSGTKVNIPVVKGMTEEGAKSKLKELGLTTEVLLVEDDETAEGIVRGTSPQEGSEVVVNSVVKLFVSKGPAAKKVTVPSVVNKSLDDAKKELEAKKLVVSDSNIVQEKSTKPKNTVLSTNPAAGTEVTEGTSVTIKVSSGEPEEKTLKVSVDLPTNVTTEVTLKVYVDGYLDSENSKKLIPSDVKKYVLSLKGASGKKEVKVNLNNSLYRQYLFDFDTQVIEMTASGTYEESSPKGTTGEAGGVSVSGVRLKRFR